MPRSQEETVNVNQYAQYSGHTRYYNKRITVLICVEGICHHLWLHYPSRLALVPFWIIMTRSNSLHQCYEGQFVDFEESGSQSLLVTMESKKYASFNFGKEIFALGSKYLSLLSIVASYVKSKCWALWLQSVTIMVAKWSTPCTAELISDSVACKKQLELFLLLWCVASPSQSYPRH